MTDEPADPPALPETALPTPTTAKRVSSPPASIVPVMAYAGETEHEALLRYGIDRECCGSEILFVHLN